MLIFQFQLRKQNVFRMFVPTRDVFKAIVCHFNASHVINIDVHNLTRMALESCLKFGGFDNFKHL
jgi:hypothetical protein